MKAASLRTVALIPLVLAAGCGKSNYSKDFSKEPSVGIILQKTEISSGLRQIRWKTDGETTCLKIGGQECYRALPRDANHDSYIYFQIDPSVKTNKVMNLKATIEYFDATPCTLFIEFDSWNKWGGDDGVYTMTPEHLDLTGDQEWKTAEFTLRNARLEGRQNGGADFRIRALHSEFFICSVTIERLE